jgi:hypothetical protein
MLELESPPRKSFSGSVESIVLDREGWPPTPGVETGIELAELRDIREFVRVGEGAREEGLDDAADAGVEWVEWCHRTMMAERHGAVFGWARDGRHAKAAKADKGGLEKGQNKQINDH